MCLCLLIPCDRWTRVGMGMASAPLYYVCDNLLNLRIILSLSSKSSSRSRGQR